MGIRFAESQVRGFVVRRFLLLAVLLIIAFPLPGSTQNFTVPDDVVLRIRLEMTR